MALYKYNTISLISFKANGVLEMYVKQQTHYVMYVDILLKEYIIINNMI